MLGYINTVASDVYAMLGYINTIVSNVNTI